MLILCFLALSAAVLLGGFLLAGRGRRLAVVHGVSGGLGAALLGGVLWRGALRGVFAWDALVLVGLALAGGLVLAFWRGRRPGLVVFLHVSAGGVGYLLLAGFVFSQRR